MNKKCFLSVISLMLLALFFFGCAKEDQKLKPALESITAEELSKDVEILSSDESRLKARKWREFLPGTSDGGNHCRASDKT